MPNRQIQLTAVYIKKLTSILRELDTYVFGQFNFDYQLCRRTTFQRANLNGTNRERGP